MCEICLVFVNVLYVFLFVRVLDDDKLLEEMIKEAEEGTGLDEEAEEDVISEEARDTEGDLPSEPPEAEGEVADPSSQGAQFERFGLLLPTMLNRKLVDDLAVEFCMTLNSKGNRKKLAWTLFAVEKNRSGPFPPPPPLFLPNLTRVCYIHTVLLQTAP